MSSHPNQLHIVLNTTKSSGGEGLAAVSYAKALSIEGVKVTLLSLYGANPYSDIENFCCYSLRTDNNGIFFYYFKLYIIIKKLILLKDINLIHIHGLWSPFIALSTLYAIINRVPFFISPHGCLSSHALKYKSIKKFIALIFYQKYLLSKASILFATSALEMNDIRNIFKRIPVALIPNGVSFPIINPHFSRNRDRKIFLYLSRIHPIKGITMLIDAWSVIGRPEWKIIIAGSGEEDYINYIHNYVAYKNLSNDIEFTGFVDGELKEILFQSADVFILPTLSENFGIAIAEALSHSLPVITTVRAPWSQLIEYECGWWVNPSVDEICEAMVSAMTCNELTLKVMGEKGRNLVEKFYSWHSIALRGIAVSQWLFAKKSIKPVDIFF